MILTKSCPLGMGIPVYTPLASAQCVALRPGDQVKAEEGRFVLVPKSHGVAEFLLTDGTGPDAPAVLYRLQTVSPRWAELQVTEGAPVPVYADAAAPTGYVDERPAD